MGRLRYDGTSEPIHMEDDTLAHLKVVIGIKLRRQESFMMSWRTLDGADPARVTVWVHPAIPLQFLFSSAEAHPVEKARIEEMMRDLNATGELVIDDHVRLGAAETQPAG